MRTAFVFMLAIVALLFAVPVMAIACAACDLVLEPLAAHVDGFAAVHVSPGGHELGAPRGAQCEGTVKPFYIDLAITAYGATELTIEHGRGSPNLITEIEDATGITITHHARDRPELSGGQRTTYKT